MKKETNSSHLFFSIILPAFNRASFLPKAIKSVINQTCAIWELIIVDDGSSDNTRDIVFTFNDSRIRYFYQDNLERSAARNNGIRHAIGDYICFLDSDDFYLSHHLAILKERIVSDDYPIAMYHTGHYLNALSKKGVIYTGMDIHPVKEIIAQTSYTPNTACIHREIFKKHLFPNQFNIWEDTHLFARIASEYPFFSIPEYTVVTISHKESSVTSNLNEVKKKAVDTYIACIYDLYEHYPLINKYVTCRFLKSYIFSKLQMFIYQARKNNQNNLAFLLLFRALEYFSPQNLIYFGITFTKLVIQIIFKIKLN